MNPEALEKIEDLCGPCGPCGYPTVTETVFFTSMVPALTDLVDVATGRNSVVFQMRTYGRVVTLQWGEFTGTMGKSGIPTLNVATTICNLPSSNVTKPIVLEYKDVTRITHAIIDATPSPGEGNLSFYLNTDASSMGVYNHDFVRVNGGNIQWIVSPL